MQIFIGIIVGVLTFIVSSFYSDWKKEQKRVEKKDASMEIALKEVLGFLIDVTYEKHMKLGYIPNDMLKKALGIYESYHIGLHGNGTREMEINKLMELPNEPKGID